MKKINRYLNKILRGGKVGTNPKEPIYPSFFFFEQDRRPEWWTSALERADFGETYGVLLAEDGRPEDSIIVTEHGLGVVEKDADARWIRYNQISSWDRLSKSPISTSITLNTVDNNRFVLPLAGGDAFTFIQFLAPVVQESKGH